MTWTSVDRWSCATCGQTVVVDASEDDTAAAIAACQTRHGKAHRAAAVLSARLRHTDVDRPAAKWGAA